ncbi:MAG: hypothetical protein HQ581_17120 [Planctomycetes bacterium]|nr:hypothetical protein [Planctomycetota bacterium]
MALIIDANKVADYLNDTDDPPNRVIHDWVNNRGGKLVFGGRQLQEWYKINKARRYVRVLLQAGRAFRYATEEVDNKEAEVESTGLCRSDDPHVIALACISGVRVLYSEDKALCDDFRDTELVPQPRGKIYRRPKGKSDKTAQYRRLLLQSPPCRPPSS